MNNLFDDLSGEELLRLHSYFPKHSDETFSIASLDGFFCGLYCLPGVHMPSEWLHDVIPETLDGSKKSMEQALNLILRYYNLAGAKMNDEEGEPSIDGTYKAAKEWLEGFGRAFSYETEALSQLADEEAKRSGDEDDLFIAPILLTFSMDVENAPQDEERDGFLNLKESVLSMIEEGSDEERMSLLSDIAGSAYDLLEPARKKRSKSMPRTKASLNQEPKLGRNDPCYCGSGKKFKHCHGKR